MPSNANHGLFRKRGERGPTGKGRQCGAGKSGPHGETRCDLMEDHDGAHRYSEPCRTQGCVRERDHAGDHERANGEDFGKW